MTKWEYRILKSGRLFEIKEEELQKLGDEGFELVCTSAKGINGQISFYFKRPLAA